MITKYKSLSFVVLTMLAGLLATNVMAAHPQHEGRMTEALGLNPEQVEAIHSLKMEKRANKEEHIKLREQIHALIKAGNVDEASNLAAQKAREKVADHAEFYSQLKQILTAEQLAKWDAMPKHGHHGKGNKGDFKRKGRCDSNEE